MGDGLLRPTSDIESHEESVGKCQNNMTLMLEGSYEVEAHSGKGYWVVF